MRNIEEDIDLSKIPRRKRRFFRNNKLLLKAISKHVKKAPDIKEIEKRKIIERLRWQLSMIEKKELLNLADVLFEELNEKETSNIIRDNIRVVKESRPELTEKDYKEIVENIYEQLREAAKKKRELLREKRMKEREVEKIKKYLKEAVAKEPLESKPVVKPSVRRSKKEEKKALEEHFSEEPSSEDKELLELLKEGEEMEESPKKAESEEMEGEEEDIFKELESLAEEKPKKKSKEA